MAPAARWLLALVFGILSLTVNAAFWGSTSSADARSSRSSRKAKSSATPGLQLFHAGGSDALSWDNDELGRIRTLHSKDFSDAGAYSSAPNLAAYLGLHAVEALHMAVPLNFIFIGFGGDGNQRIEYTDQELLEWFSQLDHILPHTRVALSEITCREDGHCSAALEGTLQPSPLNSYVHLNFTCNVLALKQHAVLATFERAIAAFKRPVDPEMETGTQQVDALKMETFIDHFISSLSLTNSYNVIVLNPNWTPFQMPYGYRAGVSQEEVAFLKRLGPQWTKQAHKLDPEPQAPQAWDAAWQQHHWKPVMDIFKFTVQDKLAASESWVKEMDKYLKLEEQHRHKVTEGVELRRGAQSQSHALRLLRRSDSQLGHLLKEELNLPLEGSGTTNKYMTRYALEDCLVPAWVGHGRWLMLDLTATPADWGPALGGEGVVTVHSLPSVLDAFSDLDTMRGEAKARKGAHPDDAGLQALLKSAREQRLAALAAHQLNRKHLGELKAPSPGANATDAAAAATAGAAGDADSGLVDRDREEALLRAELDLYEQIAEKHCKGKIDPPETCSKMQREVAGMRQELASVAATSKRLVDMHRSHYWDIFGKPADDKDPAVLNELTRAKDQFMAELSAVLSRAIRHVIAPPSATWHHNGYFHDTATPYARHVHFTMYLISETTRKTIRKARKFDLDALRVELSTLQLASQSFKFTTYRMNMMEDPSLAVAFATSIRTGFAEVPNADLDPLDAEQVYVDSRQLSYNLRQRFGDQSKRRRESDNLHDSLEVPVFIFQLDRDVPVLIDEHYNSKALEDMVLIVSNAAQQDEHPTGMMCNGGLMARPFAPLKAALAAIMQHLGGVLPPHLGYSPNRDLVTHDWLWSVGAHPLSMTSAGSQYSQLNRDALHRSYLLDALDGSVDIVNRGVALLASETPSDKAHRHIMQHQALLRRALTEFQVLVVYWRTMISEVHGMRFSGAAEHIPQLEKDSRKFLETCHAIHETLHPKKCVARTELPMYVVQILVASSSVVAVVALLFAFVPKLSRKPKVN